MEIKAMALAVALPTTAIALGAAAVTWSHSQNALERGRYLVVIGGCNDCHTASYAERGGQVAEQEWLTGSTVGFQGPWGTTYSANLRRLIASMPETQWLSHARAARRPPMPWFNLRAMSDGDLRAIYRYIASLGPSGGPAPDYVPPGQAAATPYIEFFAKHPVAESKGQG